MNANWLWLFLLILPLPWVLRLWKPHEVTIKETLVTTGISALIFCIVYFLGMHSQTTDYEIWSGSVVSKNRDEGSYIRSYECNCRTVTVGSGKNRHTEQRCETCHETRYTVTWTIQSSVGDFTVDHLDSSSSMVYWSPDPKLYAQAKKGDPVAVPKAYTNYIKAVPESLFHDRIVNPTFQKLIPKYPDHIYNIYQLDRVVASGLNVPDLKQWNAELSVRQCVLGPQKQANVVIVIVNTADSAYVESLERAWLGGKKNDVVVVLGTTDYPNLEWVRVFSWTNSEIFKVQLRDRLSKFKTIDRQPMLDVIQSTVQESYVRRNLHDFDYLEDEVSPPLWAVLTGLILSILAAIGSTIFFSRHEL